MQPITTDRLLELVGELYEAALNPTAAPQVMEALIDALKANIAQQQWSSAGTDACVAAAIREGSMLQRHLASRVPITLDAEGLLAALPCVRLPAPPPSICPKCSHLPPRQAASGDSI